MPMPAKESSVPPQAMTEKRSPRKAVAKSAGQDRADVDDEARRTRRDGELAIVEQAGVERDEADAADREAPEFIDLGQLRPGDGEIDGGRKGGDGETNRAEFQRAEGVSRPARMAGKADAQAKMVTTIADRRHRIGPAASCRCAQRHRHDLPSRMWAQETQSRAD